MAFVDAMQVAMLVAAGVCMAGALIALVLLPAREKAAAPASARAAVALVEPPLAPSPA
jgi:hypothetical protein